MFLPLHQTVVERGKCFEIPVKKDFAHRFILKIRQQAREELHVAFGQVQRRLARKIPTP
jgi:2-keto-3-deoxy-6-phosphogluconate aldolase